jgi:uncharacterized protein (TIGR02594 family)
MTALPAEYAWLAHEGAPRMLVEALKLYGIKEVIGSGDNHVIVDWAKEIGVSYSHDETPWCGLMMAVVARRAGKELPPCPLWALDWKDHFGHAVAQPMLGDVMVFSRAGGGHVSLYVGEDSACWHCLGGNQGDRVSFTRIPKTRQHWARRPDYTIQPANVRVVHLAASGAISSKET